MGGWIIPEDPFRIERRIPMSHCEHFKMLEALLSVRLAGTTAEAFLKVGQFNLTLGKRDGPAIRKSDWSAKGRIKPQYRVVMAVYLKKGDARCMECQSELRMSTTGQFAWYVNPLFTFTLAYCESYPCGRFYGNCATIKFWIDDIARPAVQLPSIWNLPQARISLNATPPESKKSMRRTKTSLTLRVSKILIFGYCDAEKFNVLLPQILLSESQLKPWR